MDWQEKAEKMAKDHVDWYLQSIRPILIDFSVHFFKHGRKYEREKNRCTTKPVSGAGRKKQP